MAEENRRGVPITEIYGSSITCSLVRNVTYPLHGHREYELVLVLEGQITFFIGDKIQAAQKGDLVFIGSEILHGFVSEPGTEVLITGCAPEDVPQFTAVYEAAHVYSCITHSSDRSASFESIVQSLLHDKSVTTNRVAMIGYLSLMLAPLADVLQKCPADPPPKPSPLDRALIFLGEHSAIGMNIDTLAQEVNISKFYLSRQFNQRIGLSISTYLSLLQTNAVRRMLVQTNLPLNEISQRCGYTNMRSFDRDFQRMAGMSPREYRKAVQPTGITDYSTPFLHDLIVQHYGL